MKIFRRKEMPTRERIPAQVTKKVHPTADDSTRAAIPRNILAANERPRRLIIPKCSFDYMERTPSFIREVRSGDNFQNLHVKCEQVERGAMLVLEQTKSSSVATKRYFIERCRDELGMKYFIYLTCPVYKGQIPSKRTKFHTKLYVLAQVQVRKSSNSLDVLLNEGSVSRALSYGTKYTIRRAVSYGTKHIIKGQDGKPVATTHAWGTVANKVEIKLGANVSLMICLAFIANDVDSTYSRWH